MESKSEILRSEGHAEERATVTFEGREFTAGGFYMDVARGRMLAYVHEYPEKTLVTAKWGQTMILGFELQTWGGEKLARLARTGRMARGFGGVRLESFYTLDPIEGYYWYGRGLGAGMSLKLRRGRKAK